MAAETSRQPNPVLSGGLRLQWGRRSMAAETRSTVERTWHAHPGTLQWGRRSMAAETLPRAPAATRARPSMGPPLDGGGDMAAAIGRPVRSRRASLGPPLDGGGDRRRCLGRAGVDGCFNGAAARWRRRQGRTGSARWPSVRLQWGRRSMAAETLPRPGAVRLRAPASMGPPLDGGGDRVGHRRRVVGGVASMGPPLDGGGDVVAPATAADAPSHVRLQWGRRSMAAETGRRTRSARHRGGFNGAAARWRRRRRPCIVVLQWGRRSMAAEPRGPGDAQLSLASMGPPLDGGGDRLTLYARSAPSQLQWGRRSMAAETTPS